MPSLLKAAAAIPMFLFSLSAHSEDVPSSGGLQATALSFLLIAVWTNVIKDLRCAASAADVERHLDLGKKMLAAGQFADALSHYHLAVEGDPTNYLTYFRRATVYLAMGKSKAALPDLDKVLDLKPDLNAARLQRANVKLKQGKLDQAKLDYEEVLRRDPNSSDARSNLDTIPTIDAAVHQAKHQFKNGDYYGTIELLTRPIEVCPWDAELHELRANSYELVGEYSKAIVDIRPTTKLIPDNTAGYFKLSTLLYVQGDAEESLKEIRECLKLDADHKGCHDHYKKVKKLVQQMQSVDSAINDQRWPDCISKAEQMMKTESNVEAYNQKAAGHFCHCHAQGKNVEDAMKYCNKILEKDPDNVDALCDRAETYILNEQFEEAVADYKKAEGINGELNRAREGSQRAQKLLKQSQKRDYYKILGVKRTAGKTEITKAYRKLAAQYHPDQYQGDDKGKAEKMFIDIAAAKEVLTDPDKRAKFDQGEDPLDPEQQAGGQHWNQGFNPFGQGGFQFKFHFN